MLIPGFYSIQKTEIAENTISARILLNPNHAVYKGHFPKQPVVPGVIQLQIIKEIFEENLGLQLFMGKVNSVKYLTIITPENSEELQITIQYKKTDEIEYKVNALIGFGETVFTRVKVVFNQLI